MVHNCRIDEDSLQILSCKHEVPCSQSSAHCWARTVFTDGLGDALKLGVFAYIKSWEGAGYMTMHMASTRICGGMWHVLSCEDGGEKNGGRDSWHCS